MSNHDLVLKIVRVTNGKSEQRLSFQCPLCDADLCSYHALRIHLARKHKQISKSEARRITKPIKNLDLAFKEGRLIFEV